MVVAAADVAATTEACLDVTKRASRRVISAHENKVVDGCPQDGHTSLFF